MTRESTQLEGPAGLPAQLTGSAGDRQLGRTQVCGWALGRQPLEPWSYKPRDTTQRMLLSWDFPPSAISALEFGVPRGESFLARGS